jgi:Crp-like helix-turn-helix domain
MTSASSQPGIRGVEAVMFFVHDLDRAKSFYRDGSPASPEDEEEDFASYRTGPVSIQLHPAGEQRPGIILGRSGTGVPVQVTFEVVDVDAIEHVRRLGHEVFDEPKMQVANLLLDAERDGSVALPQESLAALLAARRPSLNNVLRDLERSGIVKLSYRCVDITDRRALVCAAGRAD